jgi:hypothetical protein
MGGFVCVFSSFFAILARDGTPSLTRAPPMSRLVNLEKVGSGKPKRLKEAKLEFQLGFKYLNGPIAILRKRGSQNRAS